MSLPYKALCKRINRLPFSKSMLGHIARTTKEQFRTDLSGKSKKYHTLIRLFDDILIREKHELIPDLLDKFFKDKRQPSQEWLARFDTIDFQALRPYWPQVHLVYEVTKDDKKLSGVIKRYEAALKEEKGELVSMVKHFGLKSSVELPLLRKYSTAQSSAEHSPSQDELLFKNVHTLYKFLCTNQSKLSNRIKVQPIEVLYPTTRFALPIHPLKRDSLLQEKVSSTKSLFRKLKPIRKDTLEQLVEFAIHKPSKSASDSDPLAINPKYFKFMIGKHNTENLNPVVRDYLRSKKLIPNDNNIRKIIREYILKQYYYDELSQKYQMCWVQNFYENSESMIDTGYQQVISSIRE